MGRRPISDESIGLKKGPWTSEEDQKLRTYIETHGHQGWRALPKNAGLNRCGKSCRLRWINLSPDIKRGNFSKDEEQTILHLQSILGNKWSFIASYLPGRTDNQIKNFWYTRLRKKRKYWMNLDPIAQHSDLRDLINHQQYDNHAMRMQMEDLELTELLYGQQLFDPTVAVTENLEYSQPFIQQHDQNQSLWMSQLCVEQQLHDNVLPSNNVVSTATRSLRLPDNLEDFFLLEF